MERNTELKKRDCILTHEKKLRILLAIFTSMPKKRSIIKQEPFGGSRASDTKDKASK